MGLPRGLRSTRRSFKFFFFSRNLNKTHIKTCILKHLQGKKILCAQILTQNVFKRRILTDSIVTNSMPFVELGLFISYDGMLI